VGELNNGTRHPLRAAFEIAALAGLVFHVVTVARAWASLPDTVPVHFGASGRPDRWGQKGELLVLPLLSLLLYAGLTWLGRYSHKFNYPWPATGGGAERQRQLGKSLISAIKAQVMWLFAAISWQSARVAAGRAGGLGEAFVPLVLVVVAATLVVYLVLASRAG
jgi:uncharacterized membrane protein